MAWEYSEKTKELFMDAVHGKPGTHMGEVPDPDGFGEHGSIACGDALQFSFRVHKDETDPLKDVITEAKYLTFGCTSAIAASEALCYIIEGGAYTPVAALDITNQDIVDFLEGLPEQKIHCSVMGAEALQAAVFDWARKREVDLSALGIDISQEEQEEGRIVCKCFSLTEPYLRRKIKELDLKTIPEITSAVKAGGACGSCHHMPGGLQDLLDDVWGVQSPASASSDATLAVSGPGAELSPYHLAKQIEKQIAEYISPMLRKDGGDIEIVDIKDQIVYCRLIGACATCAASGKTLKMLVETTLKERVSEKIKVISV